MLLRIDRAAICGTDLHPYHGRMEIEEGFVLGHEYMGTIEDKGDGVTQFEEGDRAVGSFFVSCGKCWFCRRGLFMKCIAIRVFGLGMAFGDLPGAQSEYMRVPEADLTLRKMPDNGLERRRHPVRRRHPHDRLRRRSQGRHAARRRGRGRRLRAGRALHADVGAGARRRQGGGDRHGPGAAEARREPRRDRGQPEGERPRGRRSAR